MARVNVEQKALTDPRFYRLGLDMGAPPEFAHAVGLHAMIRVWNECIERGSYTLDGWMLQAILSDTKACTKVVEADLAVNLKSNKVRIRGTKGRIEYLKNKRDAGVKGAASGHLGAEFGKLGGRPAKTPLKGVSKPPITGDTETPPPAPAPAPTKESPRDAKASEQFAEESVPFRLSSLLLSEIRKNDPEFKTPDLQKWSVEMDRLIRIDHRDPGDIAKVIRWCQADDFWKANVLSAAKFRKQFTALKIKRDSLQKPLLGAAAKPPSDEVRRLMESK